MNLDDFRQFIESKFRLEIDSENETTVIYKYHTYKIELLKDEINNLLNKLDTDFRNEESELYNENYYEVLTNQSHLSSIRIFKSPSFVINDPVNNLHYEYGSGSNSYLLFVIKYIISNSSRIRMGRYLDTLRFKRKRSFRNEEQPELFNYSIFELLKDSLINFKTIKISSGKSLTQSNFEQFTYSFIFNLSYNLSYTVYPLKSFDEYFSPLKVESIVRNTSETLECPKRIYINDLVLHYQKALSSESLDNQYLSFYHIIEHFFEKIYNEDLQNKVRNELTKPNFSYKKKSDLENIIKIVQNRTRIQKEEFQINELEALELTLRKYITDFNDLKTEINELNLSLFDHFKSNEVPFSRGNRVNFDLSNDEIYKNLSKRIYYTRNAIVHSKETDKTRYIPFKNDKELLPEIYLMRILTEYIIIANSKEI